jgi:cyclohexadienyl dehydratase
MVLLILLALVGCAHPVRVGMSGDYPPFAYRDAKGCLQGYDVAMAKAWSVDKGRILEVVPFAWPDLTSDLAGDRFALAMSGITVRGDRLIQAPMSRAVATADAIVVVSDQGEELSLETPGLRVAVNRGGHLERVARARLPGVALILVDENRTLPDLLAHGVVDAVVTDTLEIRSFQPAPRVARVLQSDRKAYWVGAGEERLLDSIDTWLAAQEASGQLAERRRRYIPDVGATLSPAEERVADLVARRLQVMPFVAETKRAQSLPIEDSGREEAIRRRAARAAAESHLEIGAYVALVEAQFAAAKAVQRAQLQQDEGALEIFSLQEQIRPAIDRIDRALREELALQREPLRAAPLRRRIQQWAPLPGVTDATIDPIVTALLATVSGSARRGSGGWFDGCRRDTSAGGVDHTTNQTTERSHRPPQ